MDKCRFNSILAVDENRRVGTSRREESGLAGGGWPCGPCPSLLLECPSETALKRLDQVFQRRTRAGHDKAFKRHAWIEPDIAQTEERCIIECDTGEIIGLLSTIVGKRISGYPRHGALDPGRGPALERGQHDLGPKPLMNGVDVLRLDPHFRGEPVLPGHHIQDRTSSRDDGAWREIVKVHDHAILRG